MRFTNLYGYAKERSGSLRPGVQTVEETVKSVVGPVYDKFHLIPDEILRYTDDRMDHSVNGAPAPTPATASASEMAMRLYAKCEPKAESAWQRVKQLPVFPRVANAVVPKVAYCTEKYNEAVVVAKEKGYRDSSYLPLVSTERIAKLFGEENIEV